MTTNEQIDPAGKSPAIRTFDLTKQYKEVTAVDSLNLEVKQGEIYGFLGRNGAGKTTTIRMILGLISPTKGRTEVFGMNVKSRRMQTAALIGSLVETATAYPNLTVRENLEIERSLRSAPKTAVERVVSLLGLDEMINRRAGHLSLGNKQRLALARAILPKPKILVLDEPANGLDPAGIVEIRKLLRRLADEDGVTIFVSSHILGEISHLVDRIGIIHRGKLVDQIDGIESKGPVRLEIGVSNAASACGLLEDTFPAGGVNITGMDSLEIIGEEISPKDVARVLVTAGFGLNRLCAVQEDLESRFLRLTGGET